MADIGQRKLSLRFDIAELIRRQFQLAADAFLGVILQVKTPQHFAVERRHGAQHVADNPEFLLAIYTLLQVCRIRNVHPFENDVPRPVSHAHIDLRISMKARHGSEKRRKPFRIAKASSVNGLNDGKVNIVQTILQILGPKLAHQKEGEILHQAVQLLKREFLVFLYIFNEFNEMII